MSGAPIRLGPFTGGLNTASDPTAIADAELTECHNFELDIDGSLISRTPYQEELGHPLWTERILIIGTAIFAGNYYFIGSNASGVYYKLDDQWFLISAAFQASVAIQYADKVYLVPHPSSGSGGKWDPIGGFTTVAAIPKGQAAVVHKERLYIVPGVDSTINSSRLVFSDPGDFDTWPGTNFVDIGQGDGTKLIDLTVFQDNLLLFKNHSTYVFSYDVRPADAVVRKISNTIGVTGQFCMVNYENQVYIMDHDNVVYEIINYDFNRLNIKVPFEIDQTLPTGFTFSGEARSLSLLGDRLVCRVYKKTYVYGLTTRTWSEWEAVTDNYSVDGFAICAGSSSVAHFVTTDADAADIDVGDTVRLRDSDYVLKEETEFVVTSKNSDFGFTNIFVSPDFSSAPVAGDRLEAFTKTHEASVTQYFGPIMSLHVEVGDVWLAGSCLEESPSVVRFFDKHTPSDTEDTIEYDLFVEDTFTRVLADSWGDTSTGLTWATSGGAASDFDTTGAQGTITLTSVNVFRNALIAAGSADQDVTFEFSTAALATGGSQIVDALLRYTDSSNLYYARTEITTTPATINFTIFKQVGGVQTSLGTVVSGITHVANTKISVRFRIVGGRLAAKIWLSSDPEPVKWNLTALDSSHSTAQNVGLRVVRAATNTNSNLVISVDNFSANYVVTRTHDIECWLRTKNFDMAISHQFKRLWWWGADVSTSRTVQGFASPIIVNFQVYWGQLFSHDWGELFSNFWGQPLSEPVVVDTIVSTESGVARQFIKFMKGLRYRQINFKVLLLTEGSKLDGPARFFTMTILTETRQIVAKSVN